MEQTQTQIPLNPPKMSRKILIGIIASFIAIALLAAVIGIVQAKDEMTVAEEIVSLHDGMAQHDINIQKLESRKAELTKELTEVDGSLVTERNGKQSKQDRIVELVHGTQAF